MSKKLQELPEIFVSTPATSVMISRAASQGKLRKIAPRLYTKNLTEDPAQIVRRHLWQIVSDYMPGALIADRTAIENAPAADGSVFLIADRRRDITLPGIVIKPRQGAPALDTDRQFIDTLRLSSIARAYLENMSPSRARSGSVSRTLSQTEIEERLDALLRRGGSDALNRLRDEARVIAAELNLESNFKKLDKLIGALLGTRTAKLETPQAIARSHKMPFDPDRMKLFQALHGELRSWPPIKRARDDKDPLKLVIVRDMWLTGFDAPCMHTMYVDKPMHGHGLMQAIARVNRVFRDKPGGLIVDYIGIAHNLKQALSVYSPGDRDKVGIDESEAIAEMMRRYEIVRDMYHGFEYAKGLHGKPAERLEAMAGALEWILDLQQRDAANEYTEEGKKQVRRRYFDAVVTLTRAFALAATSPEAAQIRDEIGFFQAIRAALIKSEPGKSISQAETDMAVQQMVSRAVVSTEIVDILAAAGIRSPDISILSDEFLAEIQGMKKRNLALEALQKLINDEIKSRTKSNIVQSRRFSDRLEEAVRLYHNNAITAAQLLQELIAIAKDIKSDRERGEEQSLSTEEIAFYDALAENRSAVEALGDERLRVIATELVLSVRSNVSVDWTQRDSARAKLRIEVKKVLKKYGYPPDLQDAAVQLVLQQAEVLAPLWV